MCSQISKQEVFSHRISYPKAICCRLRPPKYSCYPHEEHHVPILTVFSPKLQCVATRRICSLISFSLPGQLLVSGPRQRGKVLFHPHHLKNITATMFGSRQQCLLTPVKHYKIAANPLSHPLAQQISAPNSPCFILTIPPLPPPQTT